jgi:hypothetical protein
VIRYQYICVSAIIACLLVSAAAFCDSFELRFSVIIENDANDVFPDSFSVYGNPEAIPDDLNAIPLLQPPGPPAGNYVQIKQAGPTVLSGFTRDSLAYDPNKPVLAYTMSLNAFDEGLLGLSGTCVIQLENPESLQNLPDDCLVYIRRYDGSGIFVDSYDLSDPANHSFQWPVAEVSGLFGQLDFLIMDRCTAADLIVDDRINFSDFAALAVNWNQTGAGHLGDIFGDEKVDIKDLSIIAEKWLCSCEE